MSARRYLVMAALVLSGPALACGTTQTGVTDTPTPKTAATATATLKPAVEVEALTDTPAPTMTSEAVATRLPPLSTATDFPTQPSQPATPSAIPSSPPPPTLIASTLEAMTPAPSPVPVESQVNCPYEWFFANPPRACPEAPALDSYAAMQRFEHGQMIWVEGTDVFYLLFDAGSHPLDPRQAYRNVGPLMLKPGASEDHRTGETPPPGYSEPVSGFGLIWRNEVEGLDTDVRAAFGWAREPEFGFDTALQCEQPQTYSSRTCYLRDPGGSMIVLGWGAYVGSVWSYR